MELLQNNFSILSNQTFNSEIDKISATTKIQKILLSAWQLKILKSNYSLWKIGKIHSENRNTEETTEYWAIKRPIPQLATPLANPTKGSYCLTIQPFGNSSSVYSFIGLLTRRLGHVSAPNQ